MMTISIRQRLVCTVSLLAVAFTAPAAQAAGSDHDVAVYGGKKGGVVVNSFGNCVRTKWNAGSDACAPAEPPPPPAPAPAPKPRVVIAKAERTVYFDYKRSHLTVEARQTLDSLAEKLKSDSHIKQARVVGYADRIGSDAYNEKLSEARADSVREYLISRGFAKVGSTETRWLGESAPKTDCPKNMKRKKLIECLATDRRVEVEIDYLTTVNPPMLRKR